MWYKSRCSCLCSLPSCMPQALLRLPMEAMTQQCFHRISATTDCLPAVARRVEHTSHYGVRSTAHTFSLPSLFLLLAAQSSTARQWRGQQTSNAQLDQGAAAHCWQQHLRRRRRRRRWWWTAMRCEAHPVTW